MTETQVVLCIMASVESCHTFPEKMIASSICPFDASLDVDGLGPPLE